MTLPMIVVDVGNSRIKWGRCSATGVHETVSLAADDPAGWSERLKAWQLAAPCSWIVTGVNPQVRDRFSAWLGSQGHRIRLLDSPGELPLEVRLERPDHVGIDRLLNAVAANSRRDKHRPAIVVDAGSAVTVDWLDASGAFCGGAIFPGLRLMARALNQYTALLPLVEIQKPLPDVPGLTTRSAVEAGVYWAVAGGVQALISRLSEDAPSPPLIFLTGGDAVLLMPALQASAIHWPEMTLEGIRLAALQRMERPDGS
jgi:type III pantothenate kinase